MRAKETNATWKKARKLFNNIHLWLGIGAGLILFVVCLTGTIYTFSSEIQEALNPETIRSSDSTKRGAIGGGNDYPTRRASLA